MHLKKSQTCDLSFKYLRTKHVCDTEVFENVLVI